MFRDEASIEVIAGKGGDGMSSFRREKYVIKGGPDGGDGGDGGSVLLVASSALNSLLKVGRSYRYSADKGQPGGSRKCTGGRGQSRRVAVPVGTQVFDADEGTLLFDLAHEGDELLVARGGKGGKGNVRFANSVRQAPNHCTPGKDGERRSLNLVLKIFAEVGLLGLPNAGKSTFLSRVTEARPKIADYPFTTLDPQVGIAKVGDYDTLVLADLPGLIEGAAEGAGLGHQFLRHVERCRVLLHLVDVSTGATDEPAQAWRTLDRELLNYSAALHAKPRITVATKHFEDEDSAQGLEALRQAVAEAGVESEHPPRVHPISSVTGEGLAELLSLAQTLVRGEVDQAQGS
jgi:GTP-binding protein